MLVYDEIAGDFIGSKHRLERVSDCEASSVVFDSAGVTMKPFSLLSAKRAGIEAQARAPPTHLRRNLRDCMAA